MKTIEEQINQIKLLDAYQIEKNEWLEEMHSQGILLRHKKTKARLVLILNDDENKVFNIAFRTPAPDNTGVPHILEHSVLCGSKKYPLKDPFIELAKGSLNTFLNAMTYPEKTMYPIASCNDKDFHNLVDVYLDAVFHPNIYQHDEIFRQEGHSLHLDSEDGELTVNGVVYNEMKGAFSDPEEVLDRMILSHLFPDTSYANESGGDPKYIPTLTYEQFLDFHSKYYHPSNSYIYLYGNVDMPQYLKWIDEEYLSSYDYREVDSQLHLQAPFAQMKSVHTRYSLSPEENADHQTYLSYSAVIGDYQDVEKYIAFQVLEYALFNMPGAPVKRALLDAGIGADVYGSYESGYYQPYFSIVAKNAQPEQNDQFLSIVREVLQKQVKEGIDPSSLKAGLSNIEFKIREADFGGYPKGLLQGITMFHTWLYSDEPFLHIQTNQAFLALKEKMNQGYFEELVQKYFLDNTHTLNVVAAPEKGLSEQEDQKLAKQLSDYKASLSKEEIQKIVADTKELIAYQEEPTPKEDLEKIPLIELKDINPDPEPLSNDEKEVDGVKILHHNFFTNQIGYLILGFHADCITPEELPYLGLIRLVVGMLDTEEMTYQELSNECTEKLGGLTISTSVYSDVNDAKKFTLMTEVRSKMMYDHIKDAFSMIDQIINHTRFEDKKRLKELISKEKSRMANDLVGSGNSTALVRALSYYQTSAYINDSLKGIAFYHFLEKLDAQFDVVADDVIATLQSVMAKVFTKEHLLISFAADDAGYEQMTAELKAFLPTLGHSSEKEENQLAGLKNEAKNEAFITSSQVQYVAMAGNFVKGGYTYSGAMRVLGTILNYDYLWNEVRVKGGAYGCGNSMNRSGDCGFASYRDPNLKNTLAIYEKTGDYIGHFDADERTMTKYIIGTISEMDFPLTSSMRAIRSYSSYLKHVSPEQMRTTRQQVLSATAEDIRSLEAPVMEAIRDHYICVVGGNEKIKEDQNLFDHIESLTGQSK